MREKGGSESRFCTVNTTCARKVGATRNGPGKVWRIQALARGGDGIAVEVGGKDL